VQGDEPRGDEVRRPQRAYLLRCWRADGGWHYSLEPVGAAPRRRGFGSLEALVAFLCEETGSRLEGQEPDEGLEGVDGFRTGG
jgi:hypothetical protein